jgi:hypothetical protein
MPADAVEIRGRGRQNEECWPKGVRVSRSDQLRLHDEERRRCRAATAPFAPEALVSSPRELLPRNGTPDTIAGWKTLADGFLTDQACAFHRNVEISSRYAWMYRLLPSCLKWAGMAAIASHHVRLALFPLRLDTDRTGYVNLPSSLGRQKWLLMEDVHGIRETNNGIFDDIFWAQLAYVSAEDGIECLRGLLQGDGHRVAVLAGFEAIDRGRRVLEDETSGAEDRRAAAELIWGGERPAPRARAACLGPTSLRPPVVRLRAPVFARRGDELRGARRTTGDGLLHLVLRVLVDAGNAAPRAIPGMAADHPPGRSLALLVASVVPHFRKFDADSTSINAGMQRIFDEALAYASAPCVLPRPLQTSD